MEINSDHILQDAHINAVLSLNSEHTDWYPTFERLLAGDKTLNRYSADEQAVRAIQRMLIFLGYSTSTTGAFVIDGDFGRGTNRGLAQFQYEHGLTQTFSLEDLCYECSFQTARKKIIAIPDTLLTVETLFTLSEVCRERIESGQVTLANFDDALFHLNALHESRLLDCEEILARYGDTTDQVASELEINPNWILSIIRQETAGVIRPRFEQHKLSRAYTDQPDLDFAELRIASMSIGLGQIMGFNATKVGASSAQSMLYASIDDQIRYIGEFLRPKKSIVSQSQADEEDFRAIARYYNGPAYASHFYHEKLTKWFTAFSELQG